MTTRQQRRAEIIHRRKLFDGKATAEEVHSRYAFPPGAKCTGCGTTKGLMTRFITLAPLDEMRKRDPAVEVVMKTDPQAFFKMLVPLKGASGQPEPYLRIATIYACGPCTPAAERAAAKGPSWCIVEINRGPGKDKVVSGFTGGPDPIIELAKS